MAWGGSGGVGGGEGPANDYAARGGGNINSSTSSTAGGAGQNYSGDGGGGGGGGGGYAGGIGGSQYVNDGAGGGSNLHSLGTSGTTTVNGTNGQPHWAAGTTTAAASWSGSSDFGYSNNLGRGGYGEVYSNSPQSGSNGIVIIRYQSSTNLATGGTITSSGGYKIHTFTSNGTFTRL